jgi:hypothetical protein
VIVTPLDEPPLSKLPIRFYTSDDVAKSGQALALSFDQALGVK